MTLFPLQPTPPLLADHRTALMAKAQELEAAFLSEMLAHAGLGQSSETFGGGAGEAQFASFLRGEQARIMAEKGGLGLAQSIFDALVKREGHAHDA